MRRTVLGAVVITVLLPALSLAQRPEIYSKHFLNGYPLGAPATSDLIIRDIYALSSSELSLDARAHDSQAPDGWKAGGELKLALGL